MPLSKRPKRDSVVAATPKSNTFCFQLGQNRKSERTSPINPWRRTKEGVLTNAQVSLKGCYGIGLAKGCGHGLRPPARKGVAPAGRQPRGVVRGCECQSYAWLGNHKVMLGYAQTDESTACLACEGECYHFLKRQLWRATVRSSTVLAVD